MSRAEKNMAMIGFGGMPRESSGMSDPPAAALFADSGPATPSMAPCPNLSGCFAIFFSTAYETKVATTAPPPGRIPRTKPMSDPLTMAHLASPQSFRDGIRFLIRVLKISLRRRLLEIFEDFRNSEKAHDQGNDANPI